MLTIIAFQLLPLKEVGAFINGSQMVEETFNSSTDADGKNNEGNEDIKRSDLFIHWLQINLSLNPVSKGINTAFVRDYTSRLADDIPTPPPLFCS